MVTVPWKFSSAPPPYCGGRRALRRPPARSAAARRTVRSCLPPQLAADRARLGSPGVHSMWLGTAVAVTVSPPNVGPAVALTGADRLDAEPRLQGDEPADAGIRRQGHGRTGNAGERISAVATGTRSSGGEHGRPHRPGTAAAQSRHQ